MFNDTNQQNPFDLARFITAQESHYETALAELKQGRKRSHWMWYIFPQLEGLGHSAISVHYAIKSRAEAQAYLAHPVLGARLKACAETLLAIENRSAAEIFGYPDDIKLKSSMTLFAALSELDSLYSQVLANYFHGESDIKTLQLLKTLESRHPK
jgi:uncharacterized protein (DUF1810 family)